MHGDTDGFASAVTLVGDFVEGIGRGDEIFTAQQSAEWFDAFCWESGEVGEGAFFDFSVDSGGFTQEDGRWRGAVWYDVDVHGQNVAIDFGDARGVGVIYMGTLFAG